MKDRRSYTFSEATRRRFKRGLRRYFSLKHYYGWKAVHRRVRYRNMLWEKTPAPFIVGGICIVILIIIINLFKVKISLPLIFLLFGILIVFTILEIWYIGAD